ncbi:MAG: hypothetical protein U9O98_01610, partial [Asgard group archaeon]|nr:hypothetical protein [Asgard group archaeon]
GLKHAELLNNLTQKVQKISLELLENNKIENSEKFSKLTLNNYQELEKYEEVADFLILYSNQLFTKEKNELGKDFLKQISMILNPTQYPEIFTTKVKKAGKLLINQKYYSEGIKLLQKVSGVYLGEGENTKLLELINYCKDTADKAFNEKEMIGAKHLYISAMEFSNLVDLEEEDKILAHATEKYLGINDYYSVKEFYDFAKNNYEGEKDYLAKLARLILYHATILREEKNAFEEANEFIILGTTILQQNEMYAEAAEAFLAHGLAFSNINELSISEELIQTAAKIFVEIEDLERSGDVFLALTKINIKRGKWEDAYRQIQLAIKSYKKADLMEKVRESIEQLDIIAIESINEDPDKYDEFTFEVYETAISEAKQYDFQSLIVDLYLNQARSSLIIGEYIQAKEFFDKGIEIIEQLNQAEKGIELAKELSETATSLFGNQKVEEGIELVDLATSIHMKLGQPLKASEIYFRSCNSLFKINKVVEGVKLILLASDTLMVAGEHEEAINILQEIIDLLFKIKDYEHAAMCIGQIVSHYQKTGNIKKQKEVIKRLVDAAQNVIEEGKIKDGEDLWDSIAKFSISVNLDFAIDINNQRVENLLNANMFNSVNKAFKEILTILDKGHEELKTQGEKTLKIAKNLLTKEEDELAYNFTITAINFYKKAEDSEKAKDLAIDMSKKFIVEGFEDNGILLVDEAAKIANEIKGSHEAATIYLKTGFHLLANGYPDSGELAVNKAVEIDLQTENLEGCKELGEMTIERAKKIEKNNISQAIAYYNLAITIFEKVTDFVRAGETAIIITTKALKIGDAKKALQYTETAIDYFLEADKIEMAEGGAKLSLESARQFLKEGEITKSVLILERGRLFVEKIGQFDLLSIIVNIYLTAASQHLPNRKSNIGIFFLKRAIDLANSSPNPDEMSKVLKLCQKLALEIINKKNALAGAKVLEIIADQPLTQDILKEELAQTYLDALHLSIKVEWNVIGKITRDSINYFEKTNQLEKIAAMIDILLVYVKEFLKKDRPKIAFFYLDEAIRVAKKAEIPELEITIGLECYNFILDDENTLSSDIEYQLLGYSYEMFNEVKQTNNIKNVGLHFADLASEDLEENIFSPLPYDIIIHTRHIAVRCQCVELMRKTIKTLLLIATQLKDHHPQSILGVLEDIIEGLEAYEIPQTNKIEIKREEIEEDLKTLRNHAKRLRRNNKTYRIGQKIEEDCLRILVFTNNMEEVNDYLEDTMDDLQRILRRSNPDGAYRLRHAGILYLDLNRTNEGTQLSEHTFRTAVELGQKKKFDDSLAFSEATLKLFSALANNSGLQELGKFASDTADKIAREGDIHEAMIFYDLAVEAYDEANDKESAIALITLLFQQREWDADVTVAYKVYKLAADSALRRGDTKRLMEVCNKCLNRGIAFIDQPRLPIELSYDFTVLAARKMEEGGQLKDAANAYDSVILKYLQLLDERKNLDDLTANLLVQTAFTRLATSDMDSLETITLRFNEYTELKKSRYGKTIEKVLKVISKGNISQAWELLREIPIIPFGQQYHILESVKEIIVTNIEENGRFDRTVFSTTDRSKTLSDFLLNSLIITRTIHGKEINRDVFISEEKLIEARANLFNEFELWGRIDITEISKKMSLTQSDILSIIRREFMPSVYLSVMDNDQSILYSFERLKAEISLQINQFKKENTIIDPMKIANEMRVSSDIIKEVIRELKCDEVVEEALVD